jgi:transposase-like protein
MGRKVRQIDPKGKLPAVSAKVAPEVDARVALIQALIPIGLEAATALIERELVDLVGERYARRGRRTGLVRWSHQRGSIYVGDQKVPLQVPRVRDRLANREVPLTSYQQLQLPRAFDQRVLHAILGGLATREFARCVPAVAEGFGLSASSVSRQALVDRPLDTEDYVAIVLDGKTFAADGMVTAVGVTITGKKLILGFVQTATENQRACTEFLQSLVARGLRAEDGLLVVTDGAKGLHAAVAAVWGDRAVLQRCQWHKRENVVSYLTERHRTAMRRKLQAAYEQPTYEAAKRALGKIRQELRLLNASAVASLDEGLEQTLTLHRLGVFRKLGLGLKTTNMLESIHARVESRLGKVDYWKNSDQKQRWLATALLDLEPQLRRLKNYDALPQLRLALKAHVNSLQRSA